jgi:hypothetical protein
MNEHRGEARCPHLFRLPVTVAEDTAAVGGVHFNHLRGVGDLELGTREEVAHNGLQVTVGEAPARHKRGEPPGQRLSSNFNYCIFLDFWIHGDSAIRQPGS